MRASIINACAQQPRDWNKQEKQHILDNDSLLLELLEWLSHPKSESQNCWTLANRLFLQQHQPDVEGLKEYFNPITGDILPVIQCHIPDEDVSLYQETLGISQEEAWEMVRIQNISPEQRNFSDWQFLEEMNNKALNLR